MFIQYSAWEVFFFVSIKDLCHLCIIKKMCFGKIEQFYNKMSGWSGIIKRRKIEVWWLTWYLSAGFSLPDARLLIFLSLEFRNSNLPHTFHDVNNIVPAGLRLVSFLCSVFLFLFTYPLGSTTGSSLCHQGQESKIG